MIAGIWSPGSQTEEVLTHLVKAVGVRPSTTISGDKYALAAWSLTPPGEIDRHRKLAWVGHVRDMPLCASLQNAAKSGGDYAVVSAQPNGLLLARGRLAGRCLYVAWLADRTVVACSRFKPLSALLQHTTPNIPTLGSLILAHPPDDLSATVLKEVRRVESSQALLVDSRGVLACGKEELRLIVRRGSPDEFAEGLRCLLDRVIRRSIEGVRRVAVLASGGLDSSTVLAQLAAIARGASRHEIDAITLSFAGPGDDRKYLKELCDSLGILPIRMSPSQASPNVLRALTADGAPSTWPTSGWILTMRELARDRGAELLLTGTGGDQIFTGDRRSYAQRAWSGDWFNALLGALRFRSQARTNSIARALKLFLAPTMAAKFPGVRRVRRHRLAMRRWPWAGPRLREILHEYESEPMDREWSSETSELKFRRLVRKDFLLMAEARGQQDAVSGIMKIDPLMDDEIVSFVGSFPQQMLHLGDRQRGLFRYALRGLLPEVVRQRPNKAYFEPAVAEMVTGSDQRALRSLSSVRLLADLGLVEPRPYREHFDTVLANGPKSLDWLTIWPALAVEAFLRAQSGIWEREPWLASA